jgi:phage baseplate assembly protein V
MELTDILRVFRPLARRVMLMVARGVVRAARDDHQLAELELSLLKGETLGRLERFGALGLTSVPMEGAEAIALFLGGNRDHGIVIAVEDRSYRPRNLQPGETAVYGAASSLILLRADGSILLRPTAGEVIIEGSLTVSGDVRDQGLTGRSMREMRDIYDLHVHPDPQGGTSGPPTPTM